MIDIAVKDLVKSFEIGDNLLDALGRVTLDALQAAIRPDAWRPCRTPSRSFP